MMTKPFTLAMEQILLRPWKKSDYEPFYAMSSDPLVYEFLPKFPDKNASDAFVDKFRKNFNRRGWGF